MIFTSQSGLIDPSRVAEWDAWYRDHLAVMSAVPGIGSAQRLIAPLSAHACVRLSGGAHGRAMEGPPPSLALYTVASHRVFESEPYLRVRGMGPWRELIDPRHYRRNLFDGLAAAPDIPPDDILLVVDRDLPGPIPPGLVWLRAVGLDRSTRFRGIAVLPDAAAARQLAAVTGGPVGVYRPVTARLVGGLRG